MSALEELPNKKTLPTELELCILAKKNELQKENKILVQWLEHVAGVGSPIEIKLLTGGTHIVEASPHYFTDCETCKQIAEYLARYHADGNTKQNTE